MPFRAAVSERHRMHSEQQFGITDKLSNVAFNFNRSSSALSFSPALGSSSSASSRNARLSSRETSSPQRANTIKVRPMLSTLTEQCNETNSSEDVNAQHNKAVVAQSHNEHDDFYRRSTSVKVMRSVKRLNSVSVASDREYLTATSRRRPSSIHITQQHRQNSAPSIRRMSSILLQHLHLQSLQQSQLQQESTTSSSSKKLDSSTACALAGYESKRMERWYRERAYYQEQLAGHRRFIPRNRPNVLQVMEKSSLSLKLTFAAVTGLSVLSTGLFFISLLCTWEQMTFNFPMPSPVSSLAHLANDSFSSSIETFANRQRALESVRRPQKFSDQGRGFREPNFYGSGTEDAAVAAATSTMHINPTTAVNAVIDCRYHPMFFTDADHQKTSPSALLLNCTAKPMLGFEDSTAMLFYRRGLNRRIPSGAFHPPQRQTPHFLRYRRNRHILPATIQPPHLNRQKLYLNFGGWDVAAEWWRIECGDCVGSG